MEEERIVTSTVSDVETDVENILRPKSMDGYVGQEKIKDNLAISIASFISFLQSISLSVFFSNILIFFILMEKSP